MRSPTLRFAPPGLRPPEIACAYGAEGVPSRRYAPGHPAKKLVAKETRQLWSPIHHNAGTKALRAVVNQNVLWGRRRGDQAKPERRIGVS